MKKVYCFGNTQNGELGLGGIEEAHILTPRKQRLPYDRRKFALVQLESGRNHTLLLLKNIQLEKNVVFSCGSNERSQLGRTGSWTKLELVDGLNNHDIVKISCGFNHSLVLSEAGELFAWGCNLFGQLGLGFREEQEVGKPSLVKKLATKHVVQICCGGNHCLALTKCGEVFAWGSNAFGQLGLRDSGFCLCTPLVVNTLEWTPIRQIAAGGSHSAALSVTGAIYVWGKNEFGQLGLNDCEHRKLPTLQRALRNQKIAYLSLGDEHSAALTFEGGLFTWGAGMYGQLGHGNKANEIIPRKVFELMGVRLVQVSCGRCHTLVTSKLGRVYSFGLNGSGQLGIGSTDSKTVPVAIRGSWSEINTKDMIIRDGDRSLTVINQPIEEELKEMFMMPSVKSDAPEPKNGDPEMEIDELSEGDASEVNVDEPIVVEEPEDDKEEDEPKERFICGEKAVFERGEYVEIDEYETDPDSDCEETPVRIQYIVKDVIASKGDQSFVITQPFVDGTLPTDYRKIVPNEEILKLRNGIFEQFKDISKHSLPLDIMDYIEKVFSSIPAINASYLRASEDEELENETKIRKFKKCANIKHEEVINFKDGFINWPQAFHGFNMIEDAQNEKINDLIYDTLLRTLQNMPDLLSNKNGGDSKGFQNILDDEVMRIYQIVPLFHMFRMATYNEKSQNLINLLAKAILKCSKVGIDCLKIWWGRMNKRYFKNLVMVFKNNVKLNLMMMKEHQEREAQKHAENNVADVAYHIHYSIAVCFDVLNLLYEVNKFIQKISYKEFYIAGIHELSDLKMDYILWKKNRYIIKETKEYYLCNFPFIFDAPAKNIILETDSEIQKKEAVDRAVLENSRRFRGTIPITHPSEHEAIREEVSYLHIRVSRHNILQETLNQFFSFSEQDEAAFKKPLRVHFMGEEAIDAGQGMKKEFFLLLMKELLDKNYGMFVEYAETRSIWFNHATDDDSMFRLVGILCGLAIYNKVIIDLPFPLVLYKKILGETLELDDLAYLDPILTKSLNDMLSPTYGKEEFNAIFGDLTFVITLETFSSPVEYELCPDGKNRKVTFENREEYVDLYWKYILIDSIQKQFDFFKQGFMKVLDNCILQIFQAEELMQLVSGEEITNWQELETVTIYKEPFNKDHPTIRLFWKVFYSFSEEEKKKFLKFLTGSDRIPITGVKSLNLQIQPMSVSDDHLPVAHTCFNILDLPLEYSSSPEARREEKMRSKLLKAAELAIEYALV